MLERKRAAIQAERREDALMGYNAERQDGAKPRHGDNLGPEKPAARRNLRRLWSVLGRHAAHGVGDAYPAKREPVIGSSVIHACRKAEFRQRLIKQSAGVVAGERAPGAVRSPKA